jgi:TRAP-type C4-dicarboxylate transport system substrate-binding protein
MKKKWIVLVLAIIFGLVAVQASTAFAQELKKVPLTYSDHIPPMAGGNIFLKKQYFPRLQEQLAKVGYELDITFYHAGSLYNSLQQVQACQQGLIDMTVAVLPYELSRFPLHELLDFAFMGWEDGLMLLKVWAGLTEAIPEFKEEMSKGFVEFVRFMPTRKYLHTNMGPNVRTVADLKGKKIHCTGVNADLMKRIGAVPIKQDNADWYSSLDRGLLDGIIVAFDMVAIMKLYEVLNTHILPYEDTFGHTPVTHLFSRKKFDKLPPEVQKVFMDNFQWASETITSYEKTHNGPGYQKGAREKGNSFITLTAEETAEYREADRAVHQMWIKEKEKEGLPGQRMYDEALRLVEKYKNN